MVSMYQESKHVWLLFNTRIRGYKFHFFHGSFAWELQAGQHVFQYFYKRYHGVKFRHWLDPYGKE